MAKEESKIVFCPNCQQPAVRTGNEITCERCDATFTITKKGGAKVKQIGRIEQLEKDIAEIKARLPGDGEPAKPEPDEPEPDEPEPDEPGAGDEDEDEDIL